MFFLVSDENFHLVYKLTEFKTRTVIPFINLYRVGWTSLVTSAYPQNFPQSSLPFFISLCAFLALHSAQTSSSCFSLILSGWLKIQLESISKGSQHHCLGNSFKHVLPNCLIFHFSSAPLTTGVNK